MDLAAYLRRIGYDGPTRPDLETLHGVVSAHATTVPYETFDVFLGRPMTTNPDVAYRKIVGEGRGGWCYENNGVLGLALAAMGFDVTRMTADGAKAPSTHLTLKVELPDAGSHICDPGLSDSPLYPFALTGGAFKQNGFVYGVELLEAQRFRFMNHQLGLTPGFEAGALDEDAMVEASLWLQTAPDSPFVHAPIACIHEADGTVRVLTGRNLRSVFPDRIENRLVDTVDDYLEILRRTFKLDLPEAADLWPEIVRRHEERERKKAAAVPNRKAKM